MTNHTSMARRFPLYLLGLLVTASALVAAACGGPQGEPTTTEGADQADTPDTGEPAAPPADATAGGEPTTPAESGDGAAAPGQALVEERCVTCHGIERVNEEEYDRARWTEVVDDMIRRGTRLNAEERQAVIDYLASR